MPERDSYKLISRQWNPNSTPEEQAAKKAEMLEEWGRVREALKDCTLEELQILTKAKHNRERWDRSNRLMDRMRALQEQTQDPDLAGAAWRKEQTMYRDRYGDG